MKKKLLIAFLILLLVPVAIYFCFPEVLYNYSITSVRKAAGLSKKVIEVDNYSIHYLREWECSFPLGATQLVLP